MGRHGVQWWALYRWQQCLALPDPRGHAEFLGILVDVAGSVVAMADVLATLVDAGGYPPHMVGCRAAPVSMVHRRFGFTSGLIETRRPRMG
jgi:hypothetical protein